MNKYTRCIDLLNEIEESGIEVIDLRIVRVMSDIFEDDYYNIDNDKLDEIIDKSKEEYFSGVTSDLYDIVETIINEIESDDEDV